MDFGKEGSSRNKYLTRHSNINTYQTLESEKKQVPRFVIFTRPTVSPHSNRCMYHNH